jgi:hypothetical protein
MKSEKGLHCNFNRRKMTLNSFLCKNFDKERKGYVELGDTLIPILIFGFILFLGYCIYIFFLMGAYSNAPTNMFQIIGGSSFIVLITISLVHSLKHVLNFCIYISKIKIAKCKLKE